MTYFLWVQLQPRMISKSNIVLFLYCFTLIDAKTLEQKMHFMLYNKLIRLLWTLKRKKFICGSWGKPRKGQLFRDSDKTRSDKRMGSCLLTARHLTNSFNKLVWKYSKISKAKKVIWLNCSNQNTRGTWKS